MKSTPRAVEIIGKTIESGAKKGGSRPRVGETAGIAISRRTRGKHGKTWIAAMSFAVLIGLGSTTRLLSDPPAKAPPVSPAPEYDPKVPPAFDEAEKAIAHFRFPKELKAAVWAAEPQLINPVGITIDNTGRVWVAETNRYRGGGVLDIREIYAWVEEDLASRTVADRVAMIKRHWPDSWQELAKNPERLRVLSDSSGDGRASNVSIFADGYRDLADGIASSVLVRGTGDSRDVYFANVPNLFKFHESGLSGKPDKTEILSTGYGVHNSLEGHDLHGLRFGPDGKLYFSMGDRGLNVTTKEGKQLVYPDTGTVLRCDPDGANLEVFAYGLRNPQKLCFDDHGNLFTGDNNSDNGDPAKWFYVVEGADCGWRIGYQHIKSPRPTGALLMENIMAVEKDSDQFYMTPPIAHIANGPSGCSYYPGTGMPENFKDHFILCDFRGGQPNSGIWSFVMKPKGASFEMAEPLPRDSEDPKDRKPDRMKFIWQVLATDAEFGVDGGIYVSDWTNGWPRPDKGRIYRFFNEEVVKSPLVMETKQLLAAGFGKLEDKRLAELLAHADQRVRMEAQFELASRQRIDVLGAVASREFAYPPGQWKPELARLHAIWGLGQIARKRPDPVFPILKALNDPDVEVRAQAVKVLGDMRSATMRDQFVSMLNDEPRVQFFAAQAIGKFGNKPVRPELSTAALIDLLARNGDKDAYVRHACFTALAALDDRGRLLEGAKDANASARLGVLEAFRRLQSPEVARFLNDTDARIVLEAARAINDVPIEAARPALAKLIETPTLAGPVLRRAINANFREGKPENAVALAKFAAGGAAEGLRVEAIEALVEWDHPSIRDHIIGVVWPLPDKTRDGRVVADAVKSLLPAMVRGKGTRVPVAALALAEKVGLEPLDIAYDLVADSDGNDETRAAALKVLAARKSTKLSDALKAGLLDRKAPALRREAIRLQSTQPDAVAKLDEILSAATPADQQAVFVTLPVVGGPAADAILGKWMDRLLAGDVPAASTLDLLDAAARSKSHAVVDKVKRFDVLRKKDDALSAYRECMEGGDPAAGRKIFFEKQEVSCVRCHKIGKEGGGEVGPNLLDLGKRQGREYILESIVLPNAKIAPGYESASVKMNDGRFLTGVVKNETDSGFDIDTGVDQGVVKIVKADIKTRKPAPSPMPDDIAKPLTKRELRDLVEFLAEQKG